MNIAFRLDASSLIGTGHLMRGLSLAHKFMIHDNKLKISFLSSQVPPPLEEIILEKGFSFIRLKHPAQNKSNSSSSSLKHSHWLNVDQKTDATACWEQLKNQPPQLLIIDHYALDEKWETHLKNLGFKGKLLVIDDLADRKHSADFLLDQNYYHNQNTRYSQLINKGCQLFLGPEHALLREEFSENSLDLSRKTSSKNIVVNFGGIDQNGISVKLFQKIQNTPSWHTFQWRFIFGGSDPLATQIKESPFLSIIVQPQKISEHYAWANLAIGAGGSSSWERAALELPSLSISSAQNQVELLKNLHQLGATHYLGHFDTFSTEQIEKALSQWSQAPSFFNKQIEALKKLKVAQKTKHFVLKLLAAL